LTGGFTQIAAAGTYTVAVDAAGNFVGWGDNRFGQITPPPGIQGAVDKVSAAYRGSTCALTKAGAVVCFGTNDYGEASPPIGLGKATSVATGGNYACASLEADGGGVACWGANYTIGPPMAKHPKMAGDDEAVVGAPLPDKYPKPTDVPEGLSGVTEVSAGFVVAYALKGGAA
jgi:hypothetical protein